MFDSDMGTNKMIETTDCLETIAIFKAAKNFLFMLTIISLVASAAIFWMGDVGVIAWDQTASVSVDQAAQSVYTNGLDSMITAKTTLKVVNSYQEDKTLADAAKQAVTQITEESALVPQESAQNQTAADQNQQAQQTSQAEQSAKPSWAVKWSLASGLIKFCNAVLVFSICAYSLILLFSLKISLVGRFGGMSKISGAFILSVLAALFALPWQLAFPELNLFGAVYTPSELAEWVSKKADCSRFFEVAYYLRFVLTWFVVIVLLISAHLKSAKWSKAILRRLGIVQ